MCVGWDLALARCIHISCYCYKARTCRMAMQLSLQFMTATCGSVGTSSEPMENHRLYQVHGFSPRNRHENMFCGSITCRAKVTPAQAHCLCNKHCCSSSKACRTSSRTCRPFYPRGLRHQRHSSPSCEVVLLLRQP